MALFCIISANSGSFRAHCVRVHVRYLISWWVLVTVAINSKSFPWPVHSVQETSPNFLLRRTRLHATPHDDDGLSGGGLMTSIQEKVKIDRSFNKITGNWVMIHFAAMLLNDLFSPSPNDVIKPWYYLWWMKAYIRTREHRQSELQSESNIRLKPSFEPNNNFWIEITYSRSTISHVLIR